MSSTRQNNRTLLLKRSLLEFYKTKDNAEKIVNVLQKNTVYSLRILEWFCSNYSKKYNIIYPVAKNKEFNVYLSYKSQLDSYQKKQFDPFKRNHKGYEKFDMLYAPGKYIETTVGQLNFFRWCIENKILDYVKKHISEIKPDMNKSVNYGTSGASSSKPSNKKNRKKRQPLSVAATRTCVKRYTSVLLSFE